eukprot:scaffold12563_cov25-Tisochrysis_lutea.AAC.2
MLCHAHTMRNELDFMLCCAHATGNRPALMLCHGHTVRNRLDFMSCCAHASGNRPALMLCHGHTMGSLADAYTCPWLQGQSCLSCLSTKLSSRITRTTLSSCSIQNAAAHRGNPMPGLHQPPMINTGQTGLLHVAARKAQ